MAERTFDYDKIAELYKSMKDITGDAGSPDSIAGLLELCNKEMREKCSVEEEAIFGPCADQLTLDWENFSSNFPNFVANFNNWATVVSNASGQYQQFEEDVKGLRNANPLGYASEGRTMNYIEDSYYQQYSDENLEQYLADAATFEELGELYELTAANYIDTGSVAKYQKHVKWVNGIEIGATVGLGIIAASTIAAAYTMSPELLAGVKGPFGAAARGLAKVLPGTKTARLNANAQKLATANEELAAAQKELEGAQTSMKMAEADIEEMGSTFDNLQQYEAAARDLSNAESRVLAAQQNVDTLTQANQLITSGKYAEAAKLVGDPTLAQKVSAGVNTAKEGVSKAVTSAKSGISNLYNSAKTAAHTAGSKLASGGSRFGSVLKKLGTLGKGTGASVSGKTLLKYAAAGYAGYSLGRILNGKK